MAESETKFLEIILKSSGSNTLQQNSTPQLEHFFNKEDNKEFLSICCQLFELVIPTLLRPALLIPNHVLETIANDLSSIATFLWRLEISRELVVYVVKAQNYASYASEEKSKVKRMKLITDCFVALDNAHKCLKAHLPDTI